jgi:hypothetical protein
MPHKTADRMWFRSKLLGCGTVANHGLLKTFENKDDTQISKRYRRQRVTLLL